MSIVFKAGISRFPRASILTDLELIVCNLLHFKQKSLSKEIKRYQICRVDDISIKIFSIITFNVLLEIRYKKIISSTDKI